MSRPQRKRRTKRAAKLRRDIERVFIVCRALGPGLTRKMIERVFRRKAGIVLLPRGWVLHTWLEGGTIALMYDNPEAFKFSPKPVPLIVSDPTNHADVMLAARMFTHIPTL